VIDSIPLTAPALDRDVALLETIAFARPLQDDDDPTFTDGAGI
jgi:hypothetical protein